MMPDMGCALLQWTEGPYGGIFGFEEELAVVLPNRALTFCSHQLHNHLPSHNGMKHMPQNECNKNEAAQ